MTNLSRRTPTSFGVPELAEGSQLDAGHALQAADGSSQSRSEPSRRGGLVLRCCAAMFLLGPAAIHFAAAPEHLIEYLPFGLSFYLLGAAQVAVACGILVRPSSPMLLGGAGLSLLVIGVWLLSRTVGMPVGPVPGAEAVGLPDLLSSLMEWTTAVLLLVADIRLDAAKRFRIGSGAPGLTASAVISIAMTVLGLAAVTAGAGH